MKLAVLGLGKMGSRIAKKLLLGGHDVVVWNRSQRPVEALLSQLLPDEKKHLTAANSIEQAVSSLEPIRIIWSMLPAGKPTESVLSEVIRYVSPEDIVIDGGNNFYKDTQKHYQQFEKKGVRFLDIGVSGGILAQENGYPLMVGGDKSAYAYTKPILDTLAMPHGGHEYFGESGAGHFVKMVHNGIEYGIMQSLAEGFAVMQKSPYLLDLLRVAKLYQKGTLVSGFMLDRVIDALEKDPDLSDVVGQIDTTGEADWTIQQAKQENVDIPIIKASLDYRKESQKNIAIQKSFTARLVAALRNAFGGHEIKKK